MRALCLVLVLGSAAACGSDGGHHSDCGGSVSNVSAGAAPGTVTIAGDFADGQPLIQFSSGGMIMTVPAANYDDTSATFTGLPHGALTVTWLLSCFDDSGQATMTGPGNVTVP